MSGHWYSLDGDPVHYVKQKGDPSKTRKTSLWDALELNLLPSVTTVKSDILRAEGLERWIKSNRDRAHLELRFKDIPDEAYLYEVDKEADRISKDARDRGTFVHKIIETIIELKTPEAVEKAVRADADVRFDNQFFKLYYDLFSRFYVEHQFEAQHVERVIVSPADFVAGRCDWIGTSPRFPGPVLFADWKTQKFKDGRANFYPEWAVQLAAYAKGYGAIDATLLSVAIDTSELTEAETSSGILSPARIQYHFWPEGVLFWFSVFSHLTALWRSPLGKDWDRKIAKKREHGVKRDPLTSEQISDLNKTRAATTKPIGPAATKARFPSKTKPATETAIKAKGFPKRRV